MAIVSFATIGNIYKNMNLHLTCAYYDDCFKSKNITLLKANISQLTYEEIS